MGPWLVFAALLNGATLALFQGSPLGRDFGVFIEAAGVSMLGLVPSIAKAWRASDCMKVGARSAWTWWHFQMSYCYAYNVWPIGVRPDTQGKLQELCHAAVQAVQATPRGISSCKCYAAAVAQDAAAHRSCGKWSWLMSF